MSSRRPTSCPVCGAESSAPIHETEDVPVHDVRIYRDPDAARSCPRGDIRLLFCGRCGLIWNAAFDPGLLDYGVDYESTQASSATFRRFHEELARELVRRYSLRGKRVVELGCGQGEFLTLLCSLGVRHCLGFDPAYDGSPVPPEVDVVPEPYSAERAPRADLVCCKMTLEHIADPLGFLGELRRAAEERGSARFFFQVPDAARILAEAAFWDVYYEHRSYFSAESLQGLFRRAGFTVLEVWRGYEAQYLMLDARLGSPPAAASGDGAALDSLAERVARFAELVPLEVERWRRWLGERPGQGERVAIWGGGSKAVAFLSALGAAGPVERVIDINPRKQGTFLPGSGVPVCGPGELASSTVDRIVLMNPVYADEVRGTLDELGLRRVELVALGG